jgi:hypothetical protein
LSADRIGQLFGARVTRRRRQLQNIMERPAQSCRQEALVRILPKRSASTLPPLTTQIMD